MNSLMLFTDGSVHVQSKVGYGAYLIVSEAELSVDTYKERVQLKRFEPTSSTKLELQTLLWALSEIETEGKEVIIYTDSQNIIGLPRRRARFEQNDYRSKENKLLNNAELYQQFFALTDRINYQLIKVTGHLPSHQKDAIDRLFTLVDRASRNAVRNELK